MDKEVVKNQIQTLSSNKISKIVRYEKSFIKERFIKGHCDYVALLDKLYNIVNESIFLKTDLLIEKIKHKYEKNLLCETEIFDTKDNIVVKTIYRYDDFGILKEMTTFENGYETIFKILSSLDYRDKVAEEKYYNTSGDQLKKVVYKYNKLSNLVSTTEYSAADIVMHKIDYQYSDDQKIIRKIVCGLNENYNIDLKYDEAGNLITETCFNELGQIDMVYEYLYETSSGFVYNKEAAELPPQNIIVADKNLNL